MPGLSLTADLLDEGRINLARALFGVDVQGAGHDDGNPRQARRPPIRRVHVLEGFEMATAEKINLADKLALFDEHWRPRIVATLNDYKVVVVKVQGEFVWHSHPETDDFFLVLAGMLTIQLRDRDVELAAGELFVVPRGVEHCPRADEEAHVLLIEPVGTLNTGEVTSELTAPEQTI